MKHYLSNDEQPGSLKRKPASGQRRPDSRTENARSNERAADPLSSVLDRLGLNQSVPMSASSIRQIASNLHHPEWSVRAAAAQQLGTLPPQKAVLAPLMAALEDENDAVRAAAARSLGEQGTRSSVPTLIRALHDPSWMVRAGAALALGQLSGDVPTEPLALALKDTDASVRASAAWALGKLGERAPVEKLLAALEDPEWSVREAAALALGELGERVPAAVLEAAQADADRSVRAAAQQALQQAAAGPIAGAASSPPRLPRLALAGLATFRNHMKRWGVLEHELADESFVIIGVDEPGASDHLKHPSSPPGRARPGRARHSRLLYCAESSIAVLILIAVVCFWLTFPSWSPWQPSGAPRPAPLLIHNNNAGSYYQIAWAPDDSRIAISSNDGSVGVWDATTGQLISTYQNYYSRVFSILWTSDDYLLVASQAADGVVQVWSAPNEGVLLTTPPLPGDVAAAAWSPNGKFIAFDSGDNTIQVWNISAGKQVSTYSGHKDRILALTWSPDSTSIASISYDQTMQLWKAATGTQEMPSLITGAALTSVTWSPLQHLANGKNSDLIALATFNGSVQIWETASWRQTLTIAPIGQTRAAPSPLFVTSLAWAPDGASLALATADGSIQLYNPATGDLIDSYRNQSDEIERLAWSPTGARLASASPGGTVQVEQLHANTQPSLMKTRTSVPARPPAVTLFPSSVL